MWVRSVRLFPFLLWFVAAGYGQSVPERWLTPYEKSGYTKTPRYEETMAYCRRLAGASPWIKMVSFGKSPEGRDLSMVIASKEGFSDPSRARRSGKAILLVQNGIHAGEIDGKDACLMLLRDIAISRTKAQLLDKVVLLVIPIFNVDGHERFGPYNRINQNGPEEMGWRVTAQNLNLNRDYMKADAPEMQAWLKMYNDWLPDFFIDCHVTDGADFQYTVTYSIETGINVAPPVRQWLWSDYLPALNQVRTDGIPLAPYVVFRDDNDPAKGLQGGTSPPRFSTVYVSLHNRPGLLIETHMLKAYKKRVDGTYAVIEKTMQVLNRQYKELRDYISEADSQTAAMSANAEYALQFETRDKPNRMFHFLGYEQKNEKSEISGAVRRVYSKTPIEMDLPVYDSIVERKSVTVPAAYIIPQQWSEVTKRLRMHGIHMERLTAGTKLGVTLYRLTEPKWQQRPFEGHLSVTYKVDTLHDSVTYPAGTIIARLRQPAAKVAMQLLEPEAPDAFVAWGFFNTIFEQKEYAEDYVMETMAEDMLARDSALKRSFEEKLKSDTAFAGRPRARLQFFYQHSPYWDSQMNLYPVARLEAEVPMATRALQ